MKTVNNVQKKMRNGLVLAATLLMGITSMAQDAQYAMNRGKGRQDGNTDDKLFTIKASDYRKEMARRMYAFPVELINPVNEQPLRLEKWMFDTVCFRGSVVLLKPENNTPVGSSSKKEEGNDLEGYLAPASEKPLLLESWMTDNSCFDTQQFSENLAYHPTKDR